MYGFAPQPENTRSSWLGHGTPRGRPLVKLAPRCSRSAVSVSRDRTIGAGFLSSASRLHVVVDGGDGLHAARRAASKSTSHHRNPSASRPEPVMASNVYSDANRSPFTLSRNWATCGPVHVPSSWRRPIARRLASESTLRDSSPHETAAASAVRASCELWQRSPRQPSLPAPAPADLISPYRPFSAARQPAQLTSPSVGTT